ncbi:hypothetical protein KFL_000800315 [Klebsormidium nitens]|uniref:protein acetyllysine N-acetyltransferase n=1 Tax=Klebsormidium nitens TaxID=105231 RepID=A0A1Y1HS43_KLENI|nr:hypothetical protein KFL_000800315 [Klebsormidium nitens]|eukprot:GAQ81454.1 hypothetical protein KFL_000800315 [Klebsormidium nitens]
MADLGVPEETTEYRDPPDVLQKKIKQLANLIKQSQYMVAYTGAGISTSTGIPDFRGPQGVWTLRAKGLSASRAPRAGRPRPSLTHMALAELQNRGKLKYVVSQNTDGMHRRSGIAKSKLAELHGNTNMEICRNCGREYWRPFSTREARDVLDHRTSRKCDKCGHQLHDTIVNFSEPLPSGTLHRAMEHSDRADLGLVLGTSMRVSPAADLPIRIVRHRKPLVIVNLQKTPADELAAVCIFGKTDEVMEGVMRELGIDIPPTYDLLDEPREKQPER